MRLTDRTRELEQEAEKQVRDAYENARECGEEALYATRKQVKKRPLTIVFASFLLGVILGAIVGRETG